MTQDHLRTKSQTGVVKRHKKVYQWLILLSVFKANYRHVITPPLLVLLSLLTLQTQALAQQAPIIDVNTDGLNINQASAARLLNDACIALTDPANQDFAALLTLCSAIEQLDPNNVADALRLLAITDTIAVEEAFAISDALLTLSVSQTSNVRARLDALRQISVSPATRRTDAAGGLNSSSMQTSTVPSGGAASGDLVSRASGFINGHVSSGEIEGGELQQSSDVSSSSVTLGVDYRFNENVVAGLATGFLQDDSSFSNVAGGAESDGFNITAFASWYEGDQGYLDIVLDIGQTDFELRRTISIVPTRPLTALSSPSSKQSTFTISAGKNFRPFDVLDLGGYFRLSHARATIDQYTESLRGQQTDFASLFSIAEQSAVSTRMVIGFEASKAISVHNAVLIPTLSLEYVTENERDKDAIEATLIATGTVARFQGEDRVSSYSNLGVGVSAVFSRGRSAYAIYETYLQHDLATRDALSAGLRLEF